MKESIICLSGGYDSTVLYKYLLNKGITLKTYHAVYRLVERDYVNLAETDKFKNLNIPIDYLNTFGLHVLDEDYIPNRNTLFVMDAIASVYNGNDLDVYLGIIKNFPRYPDCTHEWLNKINSLLKVEFKNVEVKAPFIDLTKDDVFKIGCSLGVKLEDTFSCNFSDDAWNPCGKCDNCKWREKHKYSSYFLKGGENIGQ